jgi:hypothetical protein
MANILMLYNATQTYTQTVHEHLTAFAAFSGHSYHFVHVSETASCRVDLGVYDGLALHYSVRLTLDQISASWAAEITAFEGHKALYVQDEYEHTRRTWYWIKRLGIDTVFTCVPHASIARIYPRDIFPDVQFVNVLTGYVPHSLIELAPPPPPSSRNLLIGYRGRALAARYGKLGREKLEIARMVRSYAKEHGYAVDIEWSEPARIYGDAWYTFVASARATLGTESGANIFDWDGDLHARIEAARVLHSQMGDAELIRHLGLEDTDGLMNQISPRAFEAIALRTVLVLFEGAYSGLLQPGKHYIALDKDGSNLAQVFAQLHDGAALDAMVERAYADIIASGIASYQSFISRVDAYTVLPDRTAAIDLQPGVTSKPDKAAAPIFGWRQAFAGPDLSLRQRAMVFAGFVGRLMPVSVQRKIRPAVKRVFGI